MPHLAIFALGPLRIELDGQSIQTSRHKALALLVYLAMKPGKQSREVLATLLWPDYDQEKAYAYLRRTIWELHRLLGENWLEATREQVGLSKHANIYMDVEEFNTHLTAFRQHNHTASMAFCQECMSHLQTAALLYRGDFLAGLSLRDSLGFDDWQFFQAEKLRQDYAGALQRLALLLYQEGTFTEAAMLAQRWLALDNLNEEAHRLLMNIYDCSGQRYLALRQFQECQRILHEELGVAPEAVTQELYESITAGKTTRENEISSDQSKNWKQKTLGSGSAVTLLDEALFTQWSPPAKELPISSTVFIGREQELNHISSLLSDPACWLLTLLGPGGIGKTRLATEVGRNNSATATSRVIFIPLSAIETEQSIAPAMASAMGLIFRPNGPAPEDQLLDFLVNKRLLLILDAFEQLVPWADFLERIHACAPCIKLLVTSRHRLLLQGEWVLEVKGMHYPQEQSEVSRVLTGENTHSYSALELFQQAAHRSQVTFQATPEDLAAIIQIARRLDGMPLGLELAATWINTLSCQEIALEISRGLDILEISQGNFAKPLHSMRAVFDHSWKLLTNREQMVLPRLAVFQGFFSRQAAEQVAGVTLHDLFGLVDKSLIQRVANDQYYLHELLRQYNAEILDQRSADTIETHQRHCAFYTTRLAHWNEQLRGPNQGQVLQDLEMDFGNCLAAWEWATNHKQLEQLQQAMDGLGMFFLRRGRFKEGQETYHKAYQVIRETASAEEFLLQARLSTRLLTWQATLSMNLEHFEETDQLLYESQLILDDPKLDQQKIIPERIFSLTIRSLLANLRYDSATLLMLNEQVFQLSSQSFGKAPSFYIFFWRFLMGGGAVSRELYLQIERHQAFVLQSGDPFETGCTLFVLGIAELFHDYRMEKAEPLLMESCQSFQLVEDPSTQGMIFMALGYLLLVQGKFAQYCTLKQRELEIYQNIGDRRMMGRAHVEIGEVLCHLGNYPEAEDQIQKGMALFKEQSEYEFALRHRYLGDTLLAQGKYQEAQEAYQFSYSFFQLVDDKGWMMTALTGLSRAEFALGDRSSSWSHARQAFQLYCEIKLYSFFLYLTLANIAFLVVERGDTMKGLEIYYFTIRQGYLAQSRWFADLYGKYFDQAFAMLSIEEQNAVKQRGLGLDFSSALEMVQNIIF